MERGFWIAVANSAGILDSAFARTEEVVSCDGYTLRVEEGEVCRPSRRYAA